MKPRKNRNPLIDIGNFPWLCNSPLDDVWLEFWCSTLQTIHVKEQQIADGVTNPFRYA